MGWLILIVLVVLMFLMLSNKEEANLADNLNNSTKQVLDTIGIEYPNFVKFNKSAPVQGMELVKNVKDCIEYKSPIIKRGIVKANTHLGIKKENNSVFIYGFTIVKSGKKFMGNRFELSKDLTVEEYNEKMMQIMEPVFLAPDYFQHIM